MTSGSGIILIICGSLAYALGSTASVRTVSADAEAIRTDASVSPTSTETDTAVGREQETISLLKVAARVH